MKTNQAVSHTPGPLAIHTFSDSRQCEHCGASQAPFELHPAADEHGLVVIADVFDKDAATLFASAPELLEALEAVMPAMQNFAINFRWMPTGLDGVVRDITTKDVLEKAQAAIRKARSL